MARHTKSLPRRSLGSPRLWVGAATVVMCLVLAGSSSGSSDGDLRLVDNGYEGLMVVISDQISEDHCNHVLHGLQVVRHGQFVGLFTDQ
ncbi:hypothetical protein E2C01_087635 [Portunus trituberculatus]|uniref:Uncharacterized protein n=1 Tax=Portunus trituberculatus TaxID=210409 RepID=A0A5B7J8N9_PORTR|nr:hypothetical protein [Portunus trituberculatus]